MHCKVLFLVEDKQNALEALTSRQNTKKNSQKTTQPAFTCSKLTIETLEQGVKYIQS